MTRQRSVAVETAHRTGDAVIAPLADVSRREGLDPLASRLLELKMWLAADLLDLEREIKAVEASDPDLAERAAAHLLRLPGKRIRPLCVLIAARLGGMDMDARVRDLAVSAELVHAATLLHDDVIDMGTERRGEPTARLCYGNSASILGGDHLLIGALTRVERAGNGIVLRSLLGVISEMIAAEAIQLERRGRFAPDREIYMRVVEGKTASLFRWGLSAGARLAGLDEATVALLEQIGNDFGIAFQLVDDVLDLAGDPAETGKTAFADLREGKLTWPLIIGAERDPLLADELAAVVDDPSRADAPGFACDVVDRLEGSGALDATRELAREKGALALAAIAQLAEGRPRTALEAVVEAAVQRSA